MGTISEMDIEEIKRIWKTIGSLEEANNLFDTLYPTEDSYPFTADDSFVICRVSGSKINEDDLDEIVEFYLDKGMSIYMPIHKFHTDDLDHYFLLFTKQER